ELTRSGNKPPRVSVPFAAVRRGMAIPWPRINLRPRTRLENGHETGASPGCPLRENPGGVLGFCLGRQLAPLRRWIPFEDEAPAGLVMGGIGPEEIDPHPRQLFGAIAREGLDGFVVETPLVLPAKHHAEFRIPGEPPRPLSQLGLKRLGILAEGVVEKSNLPRRLRTDWFARQG